LLRDVRSVNRDKTDSYITKLKQPKLGVLEQPEKPAKPPKAKFPDAIAPMSFAAPKPIAPVPTRHVPSKKHELEEAVAVIQQLEEAKEAQKELEGRLIDSDDDLGDLEDLIDDLD